MPITKGAKKAHSTSLKKRVFNLRRSRTMKGALKEVRDRIAKGDSDGAQALLPKTYKALDKAAKRGIIKKNTAARKKSRLVAAIRKGVLR